MSTAFGDNHKAAHSVKMHGYNKPNADNGNKCMRWQLRERKKLGVNWSDLRISKSRNDNCEEIQLKERTSLIKTEGIQGTNDDAHELVRIAWRIPITCVLRSAWASWDDLANINTLYECMPERFFICNRKIYGQAQYLVKHTSNVHSLYSWSKSSRFIQATSSDKISQE